MTPNFAFVSDVHSQADKLRHVLDFCKENNLTPIFLGDLFDSKCDVSDSFGTYTLVRKAQDEMNAIALQSNHQNKLIRYLHGNDVVQNCGLDVTIRQLFEENDLDRVEICNWLESFPYGIAFRSVDGVEYRAAHAYFSSKLLVDSYDDYFLIKDVNKKFKNQMLYGIFSSRDRIEWWKSDRNHGVNWIRVSGHYHTLHIDSQSLVLDGCCGEEYGNLLVYDVNSLKLHAF